MTELLQHFEIAIVIPLIACALILLFRNNPQLREASSLLIAVVLFIFTALLLKSDLQGVTNTLFTITPGLSLAFHIEPLGLPPAYGLLPRFIRLGICEATRKKAKPAFICFLPFLLLPPWASLLRQI